MLTNLEVYSSLSSAPDLPLDVGVNEDQDLIHIRHIDGLGPVKATVNTSQLASDDGAYYTGSSVPFRNIILTLGFNPDWSVNTVASLRQKVYGYFMPKQEVTLRLFRDDGPTVEIDGICEDAAPDIFAQDPQMNISVICPLPDFIAVAQSEVTGIANDAPDESEFSLIGNVETSARLVAVSAVGDPTYDGDITLEHRTLSPEVKTFTVTGSLAPAVQLIIDSARGNKVAQNVVGVDVINLLNTMTDDSEWLMLQPGVNKFRVILDAGATDTDWSLIYFERFGGL